MPQNGSRADPVFSFHPSQGTTLEEDLGLCPTTELEAVNTMLFGIGESPVASLDDLSLTDAANALMLLRRESRTLQTKGWSFNTEECHTLQPQADGTVPLPVNALATTFKGVDAGPALAVRAGKVYDRRNGTFTLNRTVVADIVVQLPFEDLPEIARNFILIRAGRKFQDAVLGDQSTHQFQEQDEVAAWAEFLSNESEDCAYNINRDSPSVAAVTRGRYRYID